MATATANAVALILIERNSFTWPLLEAWAIAGAITEARDTDKPSFIACKTVIGYGAPNKEGTAATHGSPLGEEEIAGARKKLGWVHAPFVVPEDVLTAWHITGSRGMGIRDAWEGRLVGLDATLREPFERSTGGRLPDGWLGALNAHKARCSKDQPEWATRKASGEALGVLTEAIPELIGGSADLTGSVNTKTGATTPITPGGPSVMLCRGNGVCGIRYGNTRLPS